MFTHVKEYPELAAIYEAVSQTGLPNSMKAWVPVPSQLIIHEWELALEGQPGDTQMLDLFKFGFPMGYKGPISDTSEYDNRASATAHPEAINKFIHKVKTCGALFGPFTTPSFQPWVHVSPMMTHSKSDNISRRVISDLSYI